jgi:lambda repressor-like predicted transcriptional regulator
MEPLEIKIALLRVGVTQADIARVRKVNPVTVHRVIEGHSISDPIQRLIARALDQPVEKVFPERYSPLKKRSIGLDRLAERV